jgi:YcaO-like protein with predicted kinase domain
MSDFQKVAGQSERLLDLGGTLRVLNPTDTLARLNPLLRELGITRVGNVTGLDHVGVPTWVVVRPLSRSLTVSQGKGITDDLAKISGIMESLELYHAENTSLTEVSKTIGAAQRSERFVDLDFLHIRNDTKLSSNSKVTWVPGSTLSSGAERWIPRELLDLNFESGKRRDNHFISSSNGLAAGNTKDEAIIHGLCEAIERDQISFWLVARKFGL